MAKKCILAEQGTKVLYNASSSTRDHITCVLTVNAAGDIAPVRCVFKGVRNMAVKHLKDLPKDSISGQWGFLVTPKVKE